MATGDSPPWVARSDRWPIEIELELSGDRTAIAGVVLDGRNVPDTGMLPRTIELLISSSESTRRWRSVAGGEVAFVDGLASISIAPTWARYLQFRIGDPANGGETIALGRLRVVLYD